MIYSQLDHSVESLVKSRQYHYQPLGKIEKVMAVMVILALGMVVIWL